MFDKLPDYANWPVLFQSEKRSYIEAAKPESFEYRPYIGVTIIVKGTGLEYDKTKVPVHGNIEKIVIYYRGNLVVKISDLTSSLHDFYKKAFGKKADGSKVLSSLLDGRDSTFIGENGGDVIPQVSASGDDTIRARAGNDTVNADPGADHIDGGAGYDVLTYQPVYFPIGAPKGAFKGIVLDVQLGTVSDPWGHTDRISNFESYGGSAFADVMKGSSGADQFMGNQGADVIDGREGFDSIWYGSEFFHGGKQGIDVDLSTGTIKDAFGTLDRVTNIESVVGTAGNDRFYGGPGNQTFESLTGVDFIDGGPGNHDVVSYANHPKQFAKMGVHANLSESRGTIAYDNSQVLKGIEDVIGSRGNDGIVGDDGRNILNGNNGDDYIDGGGGHDVLRGGSGSDHFIFTQHGDAFREEDADTIVDFDQKSSFEDITIDRPNHGGGYIELFQLLIGTDATTPEHRVVYDQKRGMLYYDEDGNGSIPKILLAKLDGAPTLTYSNIILE